MFLSPNFHPPKEGSSALLCACGSRLNERVQPPVTNREAEGGPVRTDLNLKADCSHPARARNQKGTACALLGAKARADPIVEVPAPPSSSVWLAV